LILVAESNGGPTMMANAAKAIATPAPWLAE
jgi:hypothetical protein